MSTLPQQRKYIYNYLSELIYQNFFKVSTFAQWGALPADQTSFYFLKLWWEVAAVPRLPRGSRRSWRLSDCLVPEGRVNMAGVSLFLSLPLLLLLLLQSRSSLLTSAAVKSSSSTVRSQFPSAGVPLGTTRPPQSSSTTADTAAGRKQTSAAEEGPLELGKCVLINVFFLNNECVQLLCVIDWLNFWLFCGLSWDFCSEMIFILSVLLEILI